MLKINILSFIQSILSKDFHFGRKSEHLLWYFLFTSHTQEVLKSSPFLISMLLVFALMRQEMGKAQPLKNIIQPLRKTEYHKTQLQPTRPKMAEDLISRRPWPHYILTVIHQNLNDARTGAMIIRRLIIKAKKVDGGPTPGNPRPFPIAVGIFLPLFSLWNNPAHTIKSPLSLGPFSPAEMAPTLWSTYLPE